MPTVTIPVGDTISNAIDIQGANICEIIIPANYSGAIIQFAQSISIDGDYFLSSANDSSNPPAEKPFQITVPADLTAPVTIPASQLVAGRSFPLKPSDFGGAQYIKIFSDVPQAATPAEFILIVRGTPV